MSDLSWNRSPTFPPSEPSDHVITGPYLHDRPAPIQRRGLANDRVLRCRRDHVGMGGVTFGVEQADEILGQTPN